MIERTMYNDPETLEKRYKKNYSYVLETAKKNLINAGCPKEDIDFVLSYGGIDAAYKNDLDCFKKFPEHAVMFLTTD